MKFGRAIRRRAERKQAAQIVGPAVAGFAAGDRMKRGLEEVRDSLAVIEEQGTDEEIARARRAVAEGEAALLEHYACIEAYAASVEEAGR